MDRVVAGALLLVDLSAIFFWKWHASAGESIDAAYEYTVGKVVSLANDYDRVVVCCDSGRSFRHDLYSEYKANRPPRDEACIAQLKRVQRELAERGFPVWAVLNFEADDVIATAVKAASGPVVIAGSDKDLLQLVGTDVRMLSVTTGALLDAAAVKEKFGVAPAQMGDYLALVGDSADNVKGVPRVGPKTAAALLERYRTIEGIYTALVDVAEADHFKPAIRAALESAENQEALRLARELVALRTDAPIPDLDTVSADRAPTPPAESEPEPVNAPEEPMTQEAPAAAPPPQTPPTPAPAPSPATTSPPRAARFSAATATAAKDKTAHRFILTGRSGAGKTFFASTIPGVFFLPIEEGLKGASPEHSPVHFQHTPRTLVELHEALDVFAKEINAPGEGGKRPHAHLVLDSLTGIETLIHQHACKSERAVHMEAKEYKKVWHATEPEWDLLLTKLDAIRRTGTHVWLIAHSAEIVDASSTSGEVYRKWDLALRGSGDVLIALRNKIRGWADHVFFIDWVVSVAKGDKGRRSVGKYNGRILHTRESATHYAKTRSLLPASLPATWKDLSAALAAGRQAPDSKLRTQIEGIAAKLPEDDRVTVLGELKDATPAGLAALLSRAQGMLAVAQEDLAAAEDEIAEAS
jgi:5'-3' exonuclease